MDEQQRRYAFKWTDQNTVLVTVDEDTEMEDFFHLSSPVAGMKRYKELPPKLANAFFEGFMAGVDWCDGQLKHCEHNFVMRE